MIVAVPADILVTNPVASIRATALSDEVQAFVAAGVPEPVNWVFAPIQMVTVPDIVGKAFTVICVVVIQPLLSV